MENLFLKVEELDNKINEICEFAEFNFEIPINGNFLGDEAFSIIVPPESQMDRFKVMINGKLMPLSPVYFGKFRSVYDYLSKGIIINSNNEDDEYESGRYGELTYKSSVFKCFDEKEFEFAVLMLEKVYQGIIAYVHQIMIAKIHNKILDIKLFEEKFEINKKEKFKVKRKLSPTIKEFGMRW